MSEHGERPRGTATHSEGLGGGSLPLSSLWRWTLWLALVAGLIQTVPAEAARHFSNRLIFQPVDAVWMAPAIDLVIFAGAWLLVPLASRWWGRKAAMQAAFGVLLFLFVIGPLLIVPRLHVYAALLLGVGLAVQGSRVVAAHTALVDRIVRRTLPVVAVVTIALAFALAVPSGLLRPSGTESPRGSRPNVLLVVLDTVRAQNLSLHGYPRETSPRLDAFAKAGVVFEHAISPSPYTLPAHASFFTGRYPRELSTDWLTRLDDTHPTLAQALAAEGYATGGFVGNLVYCSRQTGLSRGFERYSDYPLSAGSMVTSSWLARSLIRPVQRLAGVEGTPLARKNAAEVNAEFLEWVDSLEDRPFFAFLNYFDAHDPYTPPPPFDARFGNAGPPPPLEDDRRYSESELGHLLDGYDGALSYTDDQLGRLLDDLKGRGLLDDTIVVITSDHGEQFGEHGLVDHANSLYRQLLHVPLILSFPSRIPASHRVSDPVTLVDLPATILDLAGLSDARRQIPGRSLAGHWDPAGRANIGSRPILSEVSQGINTAEWLPISKGPMQSVISDGMHYIRNGDGTEELYDFETDAAELRDLSSRPEARASLERLRSRIDDLIRSGPPVAARVLAGSAAAEDHSRRSVLHDMLVEQAPVVVPRAPVQFPVTK